MMTHPVVDVKRYQEVLGESVLELLLYYYENGVISTLDLQKYCEVFSELNALYNEKLMAIFGCCQARLETIKGTK